MEQLVQKRLKEVGVPQTGLPEQSKNRNPILQLIWGSTMYHIDDLPFSTRDLPDVYTQFRKVRREFMYCNFKISRNNPTNIKFTKFLRKLAIFPQYSLLVGWGRERMLIF